MKELFDKPAQFLIKDGYVWIYKPAPSMVENNGWSESWSTIGGSNFNLTAADAIALAEFVAANKAELDASAAKEKVAKSMAFVELAKQVSL